MPLPSATDFLLNRGSGPNAVGSTLYASTTPTLGPQIGSAYQPWLINWNSPPGGAGMALPFGFPGSWTKLLLSIWTQTDPTNGYDMLPMQTGPGFTGGPPYFAFEPSSNGFTGVLGVEGHIETLDNTSTGPSSIDTRIESMPTGGLQHLLLSLDSTGGSQELFLNGASFPLGPSYGSGPVTCVSASEFSIAIVFDNTSLITEFWFHFPPSYISAASIISKFYAAGGPVDPGTDGSIPLGYQPLGYFTVRQAAGPPPGPGPGMPTLLMIPPPTPLPCVPCRPVCIDPWTWAGGIFYGERCP